MLVGSCGESGGWRRVKVVRGGGLGIHLLLLLGGLLLLLLLRLLHLLLRGKWPRVERGLVF